MEKINWKLFLGFLLLAFSAIGYTLHFLIFRDPHHIFIFLVGDIAFVFVEVLLVTLILHQLLEMREKRALLYKLNMVIGAFFSEVGTRLMDRFIGFDANFERVRKNLIVAEDWSEKDFQRTKESLKSYEHKINCQQGDLAGLHKFLVERRPFLLRLLENPNLLEHESFTELLWAVFHLTEELESRDNLQALPKNDHEHLSGDIDRAHVLLISEWLDYMFHLKNKYPYLFSLAIRTNPFDPDAQPEVQ